MKELEKAVSRKRKLIKKHQEELKEMLESYYSFRFIQIYTRIQKRIACGSFLDSVQHCSLRQQRIIEESLDTLKEGGYLMYSTCSYSFEENEKIMDHIASQPGMVNVSIPIPDNWNIISCHSPMHNCQGFRFYPDQIKGEGFFIAVFKKEHAHHPTIVSDSFKFTPVSKNELLVVRSFFELPDTHQYLSHQNSMIATHKIFEPAIMHILSHLFVKN